MKSLHIHLCALVCALFLPFAAMAIQPTHLTDTAAAVITTQADAPDVQTSAPVLAEIAAIDPELAPALEGISKAFADPTGGVKWIALAPALVFLVVWAARKWGGTLVPWFRTKLGGVVLALLSALALAFLDFGLTGGTLTGAAVVGILFKVIYGWLGMGIQSGQKNAREGIAEIREKAKEQAAAEVTDGAAAAAVLERVGRGPQP